MVIFSRGFIRQKKLVWTKMRSNHDPENGNIRNSRKFKKLRKFSKIKEIKESQEIQKNLVNRANSSNSGSQHNLKLQLFKLCWNSRKSRE